MMSKHEIFDTLEQIGYFEKITHGIQTKKKTLKNRVFFCKNDLKKTLFGKIRSHKAVNISGTVQNCIMGPKYDFLPYLGL